MHVRQLMSTDTVTLDAGATLDLAEDLMTQKRIRHLPVVDGERLVGLVSQRDLFRAGLSTVLQFRGHASREWLQHIRVDEVMTRSVTTIHPESTIEDAVGRLLDERIGCLPVVEGEKLVGILSETDCLRYLRRILEIADVRRRVAEEEMPVSLG
jgi:CBS domain-containing protein